MKGNNPNNERVMVHVRMRPFNEDETKNYNSTPIENFDTKNGVIVVKKDFDKKNFNYDSVFSSSSKQEEVYEKSSRAVVDSVLSGYNGTIFAYGQTGTGKTHTMVGDFDSNRGIIPRSFNQIFDKVRHDKEYNYTISLSFIQIYLETIMDLLEPSNENIRIREDPERGVYLEGVQWIKVKSEEECESVFQFGEKNRTTATTKMNAHSSRSHAIMIIQVEKSVFIDSEKLKELTLETSDQIKTERVMTRSMLFLVDLAGSERVKKTKAEAMRLEEAKKINYSLLVLGNCIQSLTDPKCTHISYRDSKLTRLLQESLGGNAKTSLIVTISPSSFNLDETVSSLMFGQRAMKVQNKPIVNKTVDFQALSIKLQEDLDKLNDEYAKLKLDYDNVVELNKNLKNSNFDFQRKSIVDLGGSLSSRDSNSSEKPDRTFSIAAVEDVKEKCTEEIKKLEAFYDEVLKNKISEYEGILQELDKILYEKENEIDELKLENVNLKEKATSLKEFLKEADKEKEDIKKSLVDLTNENADLRHKNEKLGMLETKRKEKEQNKQEKETNTEEIDIDKKVIEIIDNKFKLEEKSEKHRSDSIYSQEKLSSNHSSSFLDKMGVLEKTLLNLNTEVQDKIAIIENLKTENQNLQSLYEKEKEKLNHEINSLTETLNLAKINFTAQIDEFSSKYSNLENENKKLKLDFEEEKTINDLELNQYKKNKSQVIQELKTAQENIKNLEANNLKWSKQKHQEIDELNKKISEYQNEISILKKENKNLTNKAEFESKDTVKKIKSIEDDYILANLNLQSLNNILKLLKNSFLDTERDLNKTLNSFKSGLNSLRGLEREFGDIEKHLQDFDEILEYQKSPEEIQVLIINQSTKFEDMISKSENLTKILKEGLGFTELKSIKNKLSSTNFNNMHHQIRKNNFDSEVNKLRSKSKSPPKYSYSSEINIEQFNQKLIDLNSLLSINEDTYLFLLTSFLKMTKFFLAFINKNSKQSTISPHKNVSLELELHKKNENYLKQSFICILKTLIDSSNIPVTILEEEIISLKSLMNSYESLNPPEINKNAHEIVDKLSFKIKKLFSDRSLEIENLNEKIIYYLREIEILKKPPQTSGSNTQVLKLSSQLKLKEEEIERLNRRLEEHLKTIKNLTYELENRQAMNKNGFENNLSQFGEDNKQKMEDKMSYYETEINELKKKIYEQKEDFELNEDESHLQSNVQNLRKTNYLRDRIKKNYQKPGKK